LLDEGNGWHMSEMKIARFVDMKACRSIFSEKSTFVLGSPTYYQRLYETDGGKYLKGDRKEGRPDTSNGSAEYERWIVSCWTVLKGTVPTQEEWSIFQDQDSVVAIISTPTRVCKYLDRVFKTNDSDGLFFPVKDGKVVYEKIQVDHANIIDVVPFMKDRRFKKQNEYRFVLGYGREPLIDSFIFCGGVDYIETCFVNPRINDKDKEVLRVIISEACCGYRDFYNKKIKDVIANAENLFD
jgi:hypothetical protein